jgi:Spy/CpxP family protein refolding chaperone
MIRFIKTLLVGSGILLLLAFTAGAQSGQNQMAGRGDGQGWHRGGMMFGHGLMLRGLNLTEDQKTQVKGVIESNKPQMKSIMRERMEASTALHQAIIDGAQKDVLEGLHQRIAKAEWDGILLRQRMWTAIKPILTAQQLDQLQQNMQDRKQRLEKFLDNMDHKSGN